MTHSGKCLAAEGVTLSGARKGGDRMPTELWRHPLGWGPKVQAETPNSQAKGQSLPFRVFCYFDGLSFRKPSIFLSGGKNASIF